MLGCVGAVLGCRGTHWRDGGTLRYGDAVVCWGEGGATRWMGHTGLWVNTMGYVGTS